MGESACLRLLILARENVLHWAPLYIAAFREQADCIVAGPALRRDNLQQQDWEHTAQWLVPNDLVTDSDGVLDILELLPEGWRPDALVTIQSSGPAYSDIARLSIPTAYLSIDTWHDPDEFKRARPYDFVYCAQREFKRYFEEGGVPRVTWLPLACSPEHHHPVEMETLHDFVFAGMTMFRVDRQRMKRLLRLKQSYEVGIYGGLGGDEYCRALCAGKAVFNSSVAQDINMRVFEVMGMGLPLLTNRDASANGLDELFEEGVHFLGYDDEDIEQQARRLMEEDALREALGRQAKEAVLAGHTYAHRTRVVINDLMTCADARRTDSLARDGGRLSAWLPHGARSVLDVGLGMDRSRVALRHRGVERCTGVVVNGNDARANRYDAVVNWPIAPGAIDTPDAVVSKHPMRQGLGLPELVEGARAVLGTGGEFVLVIAEPDAEACGIGTEASRWETWLYHQQFHLLLCHATTDDGGEAALLIRARRYSRDLLDISTEIFERFPGGDTGPIDKELLR